MKYKETNTIDYQPINDLNSKTYHFYQKLAYFCFQIFANKFNWQIFD